MDALKWIGLTIAALLIGFSATLLLDIALKDRVSNWVASQLQAVPVIRSWAKPILTLNEVGDTFTNKVTTLYWFLSHPLNDAQDYEIQVTVGENSPRTNHRWRQMRGPIFVSLDAGQSYGDLRIVVTNPWNASLHLPECDSHAQTIQAEAKIVHADGRIVTTAKKLLKVDNMPPMVDPSNISVKLLGSGDALKLQVQGVYDCDNISRGRLLRRLKVPYVEEILFEGSESPKIPVDVKKLGALDSFPVLLTILDGVGNELPIEITCQKKATPGRTEFICLDIGLVPLN